jgi:hypothetical protein
MLSSEDLVVIGNTIKTKRVCCVFGKEIDTVCSATFSSQHIVSFLLKF